jgi:nucleoside-diphosphate-sugar epimerase
METAIVTGANGFIGKAVCRILSNKGVRVYALVRDKNTMSDLVTPLIDVIEIDITAYATLPKLIHDEIDVFYHFAWEGTSGSILSDYTQQIKNIQYTCDTLMVAHTIGCRKFILAGTINELELIQFFHAEENPPRPACNYGIAKLSSDLMCKTIANSLDMKYNTAIIGSCFGPGDKSKRLHNVFISHLLKGTCPKLIEANNLHDWIYIDDVAEMFYAIGRNSVNLKNYYIGHDKLRPLRDILLEVRDILNPGVSISFGEIKGSLNIDYSMVDVSSVYKDTGYVSESDFAACVIQTAEWVKCNYSCF